MHPVELRNLAVHPQTLLPKYAINIVCVRCTQPASYCTFRSWAWKPWWELGTCSEYPLCEGEEVVVNLYQSLLLFELWTMILLQLVLAGDLVVPQPDCQRLALL